VDGPPEQVIGDTLALPIHSDTVDSRAAVQTARELSKRRPEECAVDPSWAELAVDHATIAVAGLAQARRAYRDLGFRTRDGRRHANGLVNAFIEFIDGSEIELMAIDGTPRDELAQSYASMTGGGSTGASVALRGNFAVIRDVAACLGLELNSLSSGGFSYLVPDWPGGSAFYFIQYPISPPLSQSTDHSNGSEGIAAAWISADQDVAVLLKALGARSSGRRVMPAGRVGDAYELQAGSIVLTSPAEDAAYHLLAIAPYGIGPGYWVGPDSAAGIHIRIPGRRPLP
jgi:hypothetical protein